MDAPPAQQQNACQTGAGGCPFACTERYLPGPPRPTDLSIKKTPPRHQRVPSHEAIAKVARQHKVPLPSIFPPPLPPSSLQPPQAAQQQQTQQQAQQQAAQQWAQQQQQAASIEVPGEFLIPSGEVPAPLGQQQQQQPPGLTQAALPPPAPGPLAPQLPGRTSSADAGTARGSTAGSEAAPAAGPAGRELRRMDTETLDRQRAAEAIYGER